MAIHPRTARDDDDVVVVVEKVANRNYLIIHDSGIARAGAICPKCLHYQDSVPTKKTRKPKSRWQTDSVEEGPTNKTEKRKTPESPPGRDDTKDGRQDKNPLLWTVCGTNPKRRRFFIFWEGFIFFLGNPQLAIQEPIIRFGSA